MRDGLRNNLILHEGCSMSPGGGILGKSGLPPLIFRNIF